MYFETTCYSCGELMTIDQVAERNIKDLFYTDKCYIKYYNLPDINFSVPIAKVSLITGCRAKKNTISTGVFPHTQ